MDLRWEPNAQDGRTADMPPSNWVKSGALVVCAFILSSSATSSAETHGLPSPPESLATARVSDDAFELILRPVGRYARGRSGTSEIVLVARGSYKVNDKYPFKFEFARGGSIEPEKRVVGAEAMELGKKQATMRLAFTPQAAGRAEVAGQFRFSVCTEDRCLVERQELALGIDVQ